MAQTTKVSDYHPAPGFLLIDPEEAQKQTKSGIYLPDSHEEKPQQGKVLAVGDDLIHDSGTQMPAPCKVGQIVVYKKWGGNEFKIADREYLFIKFDDILAVKK
jgi:chaperonin GroES